MTESDVIDAEIIESPRAEIVHYAKAESLAVTREPEEVLADAQKAAAALMKVVNSKKKQITFNGETYLESGDWQTVAKFYGVTAKVESTNYVQYGGAAGFEASAVAIDCNGREVSRGEAMCLNDEDNWGMRAKYDWQDRLDASGRKIWDSKLRDGKGGYVRDKVKVGETATPLFQLRSMAQTRACAKALSNLFKWVVVLAGYKPTPAEEMISETQPNDDTPIGSSTATSSTEPNPTQPLPTAGMKTETMNPSTTSVGATINGEPDIKPRSQKGAQTTTHPAATAPASNAPQGEVLQAEASITPPQGKRLFAIARSAGLSDDEVKARLASIGYHGHRDEMPKSIYEAAIDAIDPQMKFHTNKPRG